MNMNASITPIAGTFGSRAKRYLFAFVLFLSATWASAQDSRLVSAKPPQNPEIVQGIEAALKGEVAQATIFFDDALKKKPGSRPGGIDAAMMFTAPEFGQQHYEKLRFWLEKTADDHPTDPEAFLLLGDMAVSDRRYLEAGMLAEHAQQLVEKFDADPERQKSLRIEIEMLRTTVAEQKERWPDALARLTSLRELEPLNANHLFRLGIVQYRMGDKDAAVKSINEAATLNPNILPALIVLAELAEEEGKTDDVDKLLAESLEKQGENPRVLVAAANMELRRQHIVNTRELAGKAIKLDPKSGEALLTLGIVDLYDEKFEDAEEKFLTLVRGAPDNLRAVVGLSLALCEQPVPRQLQRAMTFAKANADRNPDSVDAQATLAWTLVKANIFDEPEKILMRLFDAGELNSPGAYYLAVIFDKQDRKDEAILFLKTALSTDVNFPKRVAAVELLKKLTEKQSP